jgi:hypothetical protein
LSPSSAVPANAAWVEIETPLTPAALAAFCRDLERLYRINPYLEFRYWRNTASGRHAIAFRNLSSGRELALQLDAEPAPDGGLVVRYDRGIKRNTRFAIEPGTAGSRLTITDEYHDNATDTGEVDRSLHAWGVALREYLLNEQRWGGYGPWRWYMRRVWVPMKPSARRITFIIVVLTLAEMALIALGAAIYWIEYR